VHKHFNRERDVGEILGTSNKLSLSGPEFSCWPPHTCTPLSWINVLFYNANDKIFAKEHFRLEDAQFEDDYEKIKCRVIPCVQGSLAVKYILISFGVNCRIRVQINNRHFGNNYVNDLMSMEKLLFAMATPMEIVLRKSVYFLRSKALISNGPNLKISKHF
jgi:hypothetical protein